MLTSEHVDETLPPLVKLLARLYVASCNYIGVSAQSDADREGADEHMYVRNTLMDLLCEVPDHLRPPEHREEE